MHTVKALDEFKLTTDEAIDEALEKLENDPESDDPILVELDRLIAEYIAIFEARIEEENSVAEDILEYTPEHPIEQAAFDIFLEALHDTMQAMDENE